jgi:hypothetical protein
MSPERVRRLRHHLIDFMLDLRKTEAEKAGASAVAPEPDGFVGVVARAACASQTATIMMTLPN